MNTISVIGLLWGDEGKGKIVDLLSEQADVVVRYQGGTNAGHTVYHEGEAIALHLLPSGIFNERAICVIGNGCVIDLKCLATEIGLLESKGIGVHNRLKISKRAHVTFPHHIIRDKRSEEALGAAKIGTTARGIGPTYADKFSRLGIRIVDLLHPDELKAKLKLNIEQDPVLSDQLNGEDFLHEYQTIAKTLEPCFIDTVTFLNECIDRGSRVLFEGAQGTLLDIDLGTYPFVTSSNPTIGGVQTGTGVPSRKIGNVVGVAKAYATRVGAGPFPTAFEEGFQEQFRENAKEFGATTGRPRKCGWFDAVAIRYGCMVNGVTSVVLTKLDCLSGIEKLKICVGYVSSEGVRLPSFPAHINELGDVVPEYRELEGWKDEIGGVQHEDELPGAAREYIRVIEEILKVKVAMVSTGPGRKDIIMREHLW